MMYPFSKPCFCLILSHYGNIKSVYIGFILHWFGSYREVAPASIFFCKTNYSVNKHEKSSILSNNMLINAKTNLGTTVLDDTCF